MTCKFLPPNFTLTRSILFFLICSCLLTMLYIPAFAEITTYSNEDGLFKKNFDNKTGVTYDVPVDLIEENDFKRVNQKINPKGGAYSYNNFGSLRTMICQHDPSSNYPYYLYIDFYNSMPWTYEIWIIREDQDGILYYFIYGGNIWTANPATIGPFKQIYSYNNHTYLSIDLNPSIAFDKFYIGIDYTPNGIIDDNILYTIQEN